MKVRITIAKFNRATSGSYLRRNLLVVYPRTLIEAVAAAKSSARVGRLFFGKFKGKDLFFRVGQTNGEAKQ